MVRKTAVGMMVLAFMFSLVPVLYAHCDSMDQAGVCADNALDSDYISYDNTPVRKLTRGITNTAFCWAEIPADVAKTAKQTDPIIGVTYGTVKGVFTGVTRGLLGIVDTLTFFIPPYDKPLMKPEYAYTRADEKTKDYLW
jgi:putative exosortase-associated protein (TIGR04073 family)